MPEELGQTPNDAPGLSEVAAAIVKEQNQPDVLERQKKHAKNVAMERQVDRDEYARGLWDTVLETAARVIISATDLPDTLLDPLARGAIESLLKAEEGGRHGGQNAGGRLIEKLQGHASSVEPGIEGAARYLTLFINESVEAWLRGVVVEFVTEFMPKIAGIGGGVETVQHLQEIIEHSLGGSRMVRRVLQPFITATAITPAQWHVNKQFRPELLSAGAVIEAFLAGRVTRAFLEEELARQGWSAERIGQQIENARKRLGFADLEDLVYRGLQPLEWAKSVLHDAGYDPDTIEDLFRLQGTKRIAQLESQEVSALVTAYAARDIDDTTFERLLGTAVTVPAERAFATELAHLRRAVNVQHLSASQAASLVMDDILSFPDYRQALEREGYVPEAVAALELQLRKRKHEAAEIEDLKKQQAAQREAEKQRAADERAARLAETAVAKAQPALADVRRAYVRGHVPIERLVDAIRFAHDGITDADLAALLDEAQQDRDEYLAAVERRQAAEAANLDEAVPLAKVEDAVLKGILSLDDYARELQTRHYDADESRLLVMLLRTKMEDQEEARKAREAAAQRAALRGISLPDFARAVRLGLRTITDYAALLDQFETPEVGKALALDLLRDEMAQDAAGLAKRQAAEAAAAIKHISLEQRRRAVVRGVRPRSYYEQALVDAGLPVDDQQVELSLLDLELAEAEAARERRAQVARELAERQAREEAQRLARAAAAAAPPAPPTLTLGQVERAVRLGLLAPDDLRDYLTSRGYDPSDVELLVGLAVADVPATRQGQSRRTQVTKELRPKGVSLSEFETSVRRGLRTVTAYGELLSAQGYGPDDVDLLETLLEEEVGLDLDGLRKEIRALLEAEPDLPTLEELEAALAAGELPADQAQAFLMAIGVPRDTARVYVRLLLTSPDGV